MIPGNENKGKPRTRILRMFRNQRLTKSGMSIHVSVGEHECGKQGDGAGRGGVTDPLFRSCGRETQGRGAPGSDKH